jgi:hypothetical protein
MICAAIKISQNFFRDCNWVLGKDLGDRRITGENWLSRILGSGKTVEGSKHRWVWVGGFAFYPSTAAFVLRRRTWRVDIAYTIHMQSIQINMQANAECTELQNTNREKNISSRLF